MTLLLASRSSFTVAAVASALVVLAACSSSSSGSGTSGGAGATPLAAADCQSRCESKLSTCGVAKSSCSAGVCDASPSAEQITCLENKSCNEIRSSASFAGLCPAAGTTSTPATAQCGTATCAAGEYCGLTFDSTAGTWIAGSCKKVPAACASSAASSLCTCMKDNSGCSTTGLVSTKCSQSDGALSFGCQ